MSVNSAASGPDAKPWAYDAGLRAIQSHLDRVGIDAEASLIPGYPGYIRYEPRSSPDTTVSIVIVTGGHHRTIGGTNVRLVDRAIHSIVERSTFERFEIIVVLDHSAHSSLQKELTAIDERVRVVRDQRPFSYSAANNLGASWAENELLLFLNDDTEVVTENWLERLAMFTLLNGVGAVGPRLDFADGRIQHAGVLLRTVPQHRARGAKHPYYGLMGGLQVATHNVSAVTGACLMVRRHLFFEVGGFAEDLPLSYNDVDFCLRLLAAGHRNVLDMHTRLFHFESSSRQPAIRPDELEILSSRWGRYLRSDPYDNPAFDHSTSEEKPPPAILTMLKEWGHERAPARSSRTWSY
jgi:GT2 family glycosyltransferase